MIQEQTLGKSFRISTSRKHLRRHLVFIQYFHRQKSLPLLWEWRKQLSSAMSYDGRWVVLLVSPGLIIKFATCYLLRLFSSSYQRFISALPPLSFWFYISRWITSFMFVDTTRRLVMLQLKIYISLYFQLKLDRNQLHLNK